MVNSGFGKRLNGPSDIQTRLIHAKLEDIDAKLSALKSNFSFENVAGNVKGNVNPLLSDEFLNTTVHEVPEPILQLKVTRY